MCSTTAQAFKVRLSRSVLLSPFVPFSYTKDNDAYVLERNQGSQFIHKRYCLLSLNTVGLQDVAQLA